MQLATSSAEQAAQTPVWEIYSELCGNRLFRSRVGWQDHGLVVRYLVRSPSPLEAALVLRRLVGHPLFEKASRQGRRNCLAEPERATRLLAHGALPAPRVAREQAEDLSRRHLASLDVRGRTMVKRWALQRLETVRRGFFEPRRGSRRDAWWGERLARAGGGDWFQRCLGTMSLGAIQAVCRGDLAVLGRGR